MITVDEALDHLSHSCQALAETLLPLARAHGLQLAEPAVSQIDSPPFDKAMLDGFAVDSHDTSPRRRVIEQVLAGGVPHHATEPGTTISVMTGAPLPEGSDAIVKVEDVEQLDETTIAMPAEGVAAGNGVFRRGAAFRQGAVVLTAGRRLSAVDIALLAEIGRAKVRVVPRPKVAVLATGNELVAAGQPIRMGQICNSNGPMLYALLESVRADGVDLGIGRDDPDELKRLMSSGLEADVLIVTGGVSAGVMDLVPGVLQQLGVEQVFHGIRMRPGKPLWFGVRQQADRRCLVFGLPGNPVSTLVSFEIFVKPALGVLAGGRFERPTPVRALLAARVSHRGKRPTYHPCRIDFGNRQQGLPMVEPLAWGGSADLAALAQANGLALLPEGEYELAVGERVDVVAL